LLCHISYAILVGLASDPNRAIALANVAAPAQQQQYYYYYYYYYYYVSAPGAVSRVKGVFRLGSCRFLYALGCVALV